MIEQVEEIKLYWLVGFAGDILKSNSLVESSFTISSSIRFKLFSKVCCGGPRITRSILSFLVVDCVDDRG